MHCARVCWIGNGNSCHGCQCRYSCSISETPLSVWRWYLGLVCSDFSTKFSKEAVSLIVQSVTESGDQESIWCHIWYNLWILSRWGKIIEHEVYYEAVGTLLATYASGEHFIPVWRFTTLVCHSHADDSVQLLDFSLLFITTPLLFNTWQHQLNHFYQTPGSAQLSCPGLFKFYYFFRISFMS